MNRRLVAILAADVVDYSRLMGEDHERTLAALRQLRIELFEPVISRHQGNVIKRMGDGWLVEFPNVSNAVASAIDIQSGLAEDEIIRLRIGIHIGDVSFQEDDIFGEGINVAARLEALARPGQVLISDTAHHSLDGKAAGQFSGGEVHQLKNISRPVAVWSWSGATAADPEIPTASIPDRKPTIFVRGFTGRAGSDDEFIVAGINDALTVAFSSLTGLNHVAEETDADYVVFGIVQSAGGRCRVMAQMIDGRGKQQVWANRYEIESSDAFEVQDSCVYWISTSIRSKIFLLEGARLAGRDPDKMTNEEILSYAGSRFYLPEVSAWHEIRPLLERVIEREPNNFMAMAMAATTFHAESNYGYRKVDPDDIARGRSWLDKASRLNPNSDFVQIMRAHHLMLFDGPLEEAEMAVRRALQLNPNYSLSYFVLGKIQIFAGNFEAGIANEFRAIEADRRFPYLHMCHLTAGLGYFGMQDHAHAEQQFALSNQLLPEVPVTLMARATNNWHRDEKDQARDLVEQLRFLEPDIRLSLIHFPPFRQQDVLTRYIDGLRHAGMPE